VVYKKRHVSSGRPKILVTAPRLHPGAEQLLDKYFEPLYLKNDELNEKAITEYMANYAFQGVLVRMGKIGREAIERAPALRCLVKHGTGYDNIDIQAATSRGVLVAITPEANYNSVAEHALGLMIALAKNIPHMDRRLRTGYWDKASYSWGREICGKVVGIIGFGRVGRRLVDLLKPLNTKFYIYDPYVPLEDIHIGEKVTSLEKLLINSDFVIVTCPRTDETYHLISFNELASMKRTAFLINISRGGIIDEKALIEALKKDLVAGVALDVFEQEPPPQESPLWKFPNTVFTPHIAGTTREASERMGISAVEFLIEYLIHGKVQEWKVVNKEILS